MFHIVANLEDQFTSLEEVIRVFEKRPVVYPWVPYNRMLGEDDTTKRICVAPTIKQCFTALGIQGRFARCLKRHSLVPGEYSCEVYPIMLLRFADDEDYYYPTMAEVPDVLETGEAWLTSPTAPVSAELVWLAEDSLGYDPENPHVCLSAWLYDVPQEEENHPWLNGFGHFLGDKFN